MKRPRLTAEQRRVLIILAQGGHIERFHHGNDERGRVIYDLREMHYRDDHGRTDMSDMEEISQATANSLWRRDLIQCMTYGKLQWVFTGTAVTLELALELLKPEERSSPWAFHVNRPIQPFFKV